MMYTDQKQIYLEEREEELISADGNYIKHSIWHLGMEWARYLAIQSRDLCLWLTHYVEEVPCILRVSPSFRYLSNLDFAF